MWSLKFSSSDKNINLFIDIFWIQSRLIYYLANNKGKLTFVKSKIFLLEIVEGIGGVGGLGVVLFKGLNVKLFLMFYFDQEKTCF